MSKELTHINESGEATMVNVAHKDITIRFAQAECYVVMSATTRDSILEGGPKGEALATARIAGIMAAKKTSELIPLCHGISPDSVEVTIEPYEDNAFKISSSVTIKARTGVEMEAMVSVSVAALTVYDMGKALDKGITISNIQLVKKSGGKSGEWTR